MNLCALGLLHGGLRLRVYEAVPGQQLSAGVHTCRDIVVCEDLLYEHAHMQCFEGLLGTCT